MVARIFLVAVVGMVIALALSTGAPQAGKRPTFGERWPDVETALAGVPPMHAEIKELMGRKFLCFYWDNRSRPEAFDYTGIVYKCRLVGKKGSKA